MVWIWELRPSVTAFVMRWAKKVRTLGRWRWIRRAVSITGVRRECVAQIPPLPVALGPADAGVVPELAQALLERPRAAGFERQGLELGEPRSVLLRQILLGVEPQVFPAAQRVVPHRGQGAVFAFADVVDSLPNVGHDVIAILWSVLRDEPRSPSGRPKLGIPGLGTPHNDQGYKLSSQVSIDGFCQAAGLRPAGWPMGVTASRARRFWARSISA